MGRVEDLTRNRALQPRVVCVEFHHLVTVLWSAALYAQIDPGFPVSHSGPGGFRVRRDFPAAPGSSFFLQNGLWFLP
jgi:hypothetical protein